MSVSARARVARSTHFVRLVVRHQIHVLFLDVDHVDVAAERTAHHTALVVGGITLEREAELLMSVLFDPLIQLQESLVHHLVVAHRKSARVDIAALHHRRIPSARVANHVPFAIFIV